MVAVADVSGNGSGWRRSSGKPAVLWEALQGRCGLADVCIRGTLLSSTIRAANSSSMREFILATLSDMGYDKLEGIEHPVRNFAYRYSTQDKGAPAEATGMVGIPVGLEDQGPLPVLLWLHPTTGFSDDCAPSGDPLLGPGQSSILASLGYIVVAPDFIGMIGLGEPSPTGTIHPYMVAQPTALASLDAVRAALKYLAEDPDLPDGDPSRVILWGGSQGGHACFMTERYQPHYAPELDIMAVAAAIPGTDLLAQAEYGISTWSDTSQLLAAVIIAHNAWFDLGELPEILTDQAPGYIASTAPGLMASQCSAGDVYSGLEGVDEVYTEAVRAAVATGTFDDFSPWGCYLRESSADRMSIPRLSDTPFLATFGEKDELSHTPTELAAMARYCANGYRIEQVNCADMMHAEAGTATLHYMHKWTQARLAGEPWAEDRICGSADPMNCDEL